MSHTLTLTGDAITLTHDGEEIWSTRRDPRFCRKFNVEQLGEDDLASILDYLVTHDIVTEDQAGEVECIEEFHDEEDDDHDENDDYDSDEDDDDED